MVGPFLTRAADTQAGGAATRSALRATFRDVRTTEAPAVSSSQTDEDAERADPVRPRPGRAVPEVPAHALCPAPLGFRLERDTWPGQPPAPTSAQKGARILARTGSHLEAAGLECARAPAGTRQKPSDLPASRRD